MHGTLLFVFLILGAAASLPASQPDHLQKALLLKAKGLRPEVLQQALAARTIATQQGAISRPDLLTVIDFTLPSVQKRLWTFDLANRRLLFEEYVAHGRNSGENRTVKVSNVDGSLMSSLGVFRTDEPYFGKNGYSLRIIGLEKGFNENVYSRAIVIHGAWYVSEDMIRQYGRLGRSYGCPAVRQEISTPLIDTIKNGSILFAFYPQEDWLKRSAYLQKPSADPTAP